MPQALAVGSSGRVCKLAVAVGSHNIAGFVV